MDYLLLTICFIWRLFLGSTFRLESLRFNKRLLIGFGHFPPNQSENGFLSILSSDYYQNTSGYRQNNIVCDCLARHFPELSKQNKNLNIQLDFINGKTARLVALDYFYNCNELLCTVISRGSSGTWQCRVQVVMFCVISRTSDSWYVIQVYVILMLNHHDDALHVVIWFRVLKLLDHGHRRTRIVPWIKIDLSLL